MNEATPKSATSSGHQLPIHFIKSNSFRVVHANGAWYGGDTQGNLHLTFYNERSPIPKMVVVNLDETGIILGEVKRESKQGIIREMEVDVVLSLQAATELYQTLGENLKSIQENSKRPMDEKAKAFFEKNTT